MIIFIRPAISGMYNYSRIPGPIEAVLTRLEGFVDGWDFVGIRETLEKMRITNPHLRGLFIEFFFN